jgi:inositol 3-alpha-galactosyltransferase
MLWYDTDYAPSRPHRQRLVLIDGDMMLKQNMDELFNIPLEPDQIACNFACVCNLDKSSWAPEDW